MKNLTFIIFSEDHWNTLGLVRGLGEQGYSPIVIFLADQVEPLLANHSKYCKKAHIVYSLDEGLNILLQYADKNQKPFLLTGMDRIQIFIDQHYDILIDKFYFFNAGKQGRVTELMNKELQRRIAETCGFKTIKSEILSRGEVPTTLTYPIITKAIDSHAYGWKDSMQICDDLADLQHFYSTFKGSSILVQEFIDKKNEIQISCLAFNDGESVYIPLKVLHHRLTRESFGTYSYVDRLTDETLISSVKNFVSKLKFNGIFEIEFIIDKNNTLYFLEINLRASAYVYIFTRAGFQIPLIWALGMSKEHIDNALLACEKLPMNVILGPSDFKSHVLKGKVNLITWLKDFFTADIYFYFNKKDIKPFFYMIVSMFRTYVLKK